MDWPLPLVLLVGAVAWFGHAFLFTVLLNWCYAQSIRRRILRAIRAAIAIFVFGFPLAYALVVWIGKPNIVFFVYLCVCILAAAVYLPVISILRALRKPPAAIVENSVQVLDVAAHLGQLPIGNGKQWRLACLPKNQIFQVECRELRVALPRLPDAWRGLSILHLSDIHLCGTPGRQFYQCVFDHVMSRGTPDIVALTGDVIDSAHHHRWIAPLVGRLNWKEAGLAVLGNHDAYYEPDGVRRRLKRLGFHVLGNSWQTVEIRGQPMIVIGNETPWFRPAPDLNGAPDDVFRLCLSHTPDNFAWTQHNRIDLVLAGHVHGGQIRLPGIGPLFVPSRYSRRYDRGQFAAGPTVMCISTGLSGREPLRYNCRPEITRIILIPG
jgi:predicted MPP superfamily phosphohydrolase